MMRVTWSHNVLCHAIVITMCTFVSSSSVRLYGGSSEKEGVVHVKVADIWKGICNDGWDALDAMVTCRQLGFTQGYAMLFNDDYVQPPRKTTDVPLVDITMKDNWGAADYVNDDDYGEQGSKTEAFGLGSTEFFMIIGNEFACNGSEETLLSCLYKPFNGYCRKRAGVVCDITPQQFNLLLANVQGDYQALSYTIAPNGHPKGRVLAVQKRDYTRVIVTGGVCDLGEKVAPIMCDDTQGYTNGGRVTQPPNFENLPMLVNRLSCNSAYWIGVCDAEFSVDGACPAGVHGKGVECYTTMRLSVMGTLVFAGVATITILIVGICSIHWIRKDRKSGFNHSILRMSDDGGPVSN
ncbi:egg peptide speract receptor-like [Lytechinus variegatus]|uniref:egg peptide speract receptor-like n=1 Tax=Lytechinus variegatus TaxID=7654 RepID=UPI001BB1190E|nr:egg peptide speract receptor-like [Lytechinus variegatus]